MMVRHSIKCVVCGKNYTLRIGIGKKSYQEHTFDCTNCGSEIILGIDLSKNEFEYKSNCELSNEEGLILDIYSLLWLREFFHFQIIQAKKRDPPTPPTPLYLLLLILYVLIS